MHPSMNTQAVILVEAGLFLLLLCVHSHSNYSILELQDSKLPPAAGKLHVCNTLLMWEWPSTAIKVHVLTQKFHSWKDGLLDVCRSVATKLFIMGLFIF